MKTKLLILIMLILCLSCGTNNNPVSDAQKEKIKGEVKEVVNTFFKGCEEVNFDMAIEPFLDSPDFVYIYNGSTLSYKDCVDAFKPLFSTQINQKFTIVDERYAFPDNSTVLYTTNFKGTSNFKDGHSSLADPVAMLLVLKKIDSKWKIIYGVESSVDKSINSESAKGLNQAELLMKFAGNWEAPAGKETTQFVQFKRLQGENILSLYTKGTSKGKIVFEGTGFWGYDKSKNKIDLSVIMSGSNVFHYIGEFTSPDKLELFDVNSATGNKFIFERLSPDEFKETTIENNKETSRISKRIK